MSKPENKAGIDGVEEASSYLLVWQMRFTLLEEYIIKILEKAGAYADDEIANILGIDPEDVDYIVGGDGLEDYVQGDNARRTLKQGFTKREYAIAKRGDKEKYFVPGVREYYEEALLAEYNYKEISFEEVPKELADAKAEKYYIINKSCHKEA